MWNSYVELYFTTATILDWKQLLRKDKYKEVIINSLRFLEKENRVGIYAFVIMPNHIHLVWHINEPHTLKKVQHSFLKFTAQQIKFDLQKHDPKLLESFKVDKKDREFQFWQEKTLSIAIYTDKVLRQKINYIHNNPLQRKWRLVEKPEDYKYSSAYYYFYDEKNWDFLL